MENDEQLAKIQETLELILLALRKTNKSGSDPDWMSEVGEDPIYETAKNLVIEAKKASASFLQRRLRIGYARAARLIDIMEEKGIIEAGNDAKPRKVLIKKGE